MNTVFNTVDKRTAYASMMEKMNELNRYNKEFMTIDFKTFGSDAIGFNEHSENIYIVMDCGICMFVCIKRDCNKDDDPANYYDDGILDEDIQYLWTNPNNGEEHINKNINEILLIKKHFDNCEFCKNEFCEYCND